jgi:hypothetical protein|tara:strand:- start:224 stop:325 length:102 start_codon:yes stop_codon:yes gene_type:complete
MLVVAVVHDNLQQLVELEEVVAEVLVVEEMVQV